MTKSRMVSVRSMKYLVSCVCGYLSLPSLDGYSFQCSFSRRVW
jgi:hypothetical protein